MKKITKITKILSLILAVLSCGCIFTACGQRDANTVIVGASPSPHAFILEQCIPILKEQGYTLKIQEYNDYITPNLAVTENECDANFFQHKPYLDTYNANYKSNLVSVCAVHFEPLAIYAGKQNSIQNLPNGAKIAIPLDTSNEARALHLLQEIGLITLKDGVGLTATVKDIVSNPKNLNVIEMEASLIATVRDDCDLVVLNGNFALGAGLKVSDSLACESASGQGALTYANLLVVSEGNQNNPAIIALKNALLSSKIRDYILNTFNGSVLPVF